MKVKYSKVSYIGGIFEDLDGNRIIAPKGIIKLNGEEGKLLPKTSEYREHGSQGTTTVYDFIVKESLDIIELKGGEEFEAEDVEYIKKNPLFNDRNILNVNGFGGGFNYDL